MLLGSNVGGGENVCHFGGQSGASGVVTLWPSAGAPQGHCVYDGLSSEGFTCGARKDLPLTFRMMAPSTSRSRKAIASGPSERYSPHLSKSTLVTSAVERF